MMQGGHVTCFDGAVPSFSWVSFSFEESQIRDTNAAETAPSGRLPFGIAGALQANEN
jgi:hypothetical protein